MNLSQRVGAFFVLTSAAVVTFLHSPWTGYETTHYFSIGSYSSISDLGFFDWNTKSPVVFWFGRIGNVLPSLGLIAVIGAAWHRIFRDSATMAEPSSDA